VVWTARTSAPTEEPALVGAETVLVRQECRATVLRLTDGHPLYDARTTGDAVGVADGQLWVVDRDAAEVDGLPLPGARTSTGSSYPDDVELTAAVVDDALVVADGRNLTSGTEDGLASLPVLRSPVFERLGVWLVVGSADGSFYGVDGSRSWRVTAPLDGTSSPRIVVTGKALLLTTGTPDSPTGTWTARVDPRTGRVLWSRLGWSVAGSDDRTVVLARPGRRTAVDLATGRTLWQGPARGPLAVVAGVVAQQPDSRSGFETLAGSDARTGKQLWSVRPQRAYVMADAGGRLLVSDGATVTALDTRTGHPHWQRPTRHGAMLTPVGAARVLVVDSDPVPHLGH
jgi:outer membrane protein assembly factor BamB